MRNIYRPTCSLKEIPPVLVGFVLLDLFYVMFYRSLFVLLAIVFLSYFDLQLLITPLISSKFSHLLHYRNPMTHKLTVYTEVVLNGTNKVVQSIPTRVEEYSIQHFEIKDDHWSPRTEISMTFKTHKSTQYRKFIPRLKKSIMT